MANRFFYRLCFFILAGSIYPKLYGMQYNVVQGTESHWNFVENTLTSMHADFFQKQYSDEKERKNYLTTCFSSLFSSIFWDKKFDLNMYEEQNNTNLFEAINVPIGFIIFITDADKIKILNIESQQFDRSFLLLLWMQSIRTMYPQARTLYAIAPIKTSNCEDYPDNHFIRNGFTETSDELAVNHLSDEQKVTIIGLKFELT